MKKAIKTQVRIFDSLGKVIEEYSVDMSPEVVKRIKDISEYDTLTQSYLKNSNYDGEDCIKEFVFN